MLALDDSGSMKKTDPKGLSKQAAELFVHLMSKESELGVISFANNAKVIWALDKLNEKEQKLKAQKAIKSLRRRGTRTNIELALVEALKVLGGVKDGKKSLLLLTDGKIDFDNNPEVDSQDELESRQRILNEIVKQYSRLKIPVYTIAFGDDTDKDLLLAIAKQTGGVFFEINNAKQVAKVYFKVFNQIEKPQFAPLSNGRFKIDNTINEATLIVQSDFNRKKIIIKDPKGRRYRPDRPSKKVLWGGNKAYLMATIRKPRPGTWQVVGIDDFGSKVMLLTDIKLDVPEPASNYYQDEPVHVLAMLDTGEDDRELPIDLRFKVEVIDKDGTTVAASPLVEEGTKAGKCTGNVVGRYDNGYYAGRLMFEKPFPPAGIYILKFIAIADTFSREREYSIRILDGSWVELSHTEAQFAEGVPLEFLLKNRSNVINRDVHAEGLAPFIDQSNKVSLTVTSPEGKSLEIPLSKSGELLVARYPEKSVPGIYSLSIKANMSDESFVCFKQQKTLEFKYLSTSNQVKEEHSNGKLWVMVIIGAIILLCSIIIIVIYKKRSSQSLAIDSEFEPDETDVVRIITEKDKLEVAGEKEEKETIPNKEPLETTHDVKVKQKEILETSTNIPEEKINLSTADVMGELVPKVSEEKPKTQKEEKPDELDNLINQDIPSTSAKEDIGSMDLSEIDDLISQMDSISDEDVEETVPENEVPALDISPDDEKEDENRSALSKAEYNAIDKAIDKMNRIATLQDASIDEESGKKPKDEEAEQELEEKMVDQAKLEETNDSESPAEEEPADSADGSTIDQDMINQMLAANDDAEAEKAEEPADSTDGGTIDQDVINQMLAANDDAEAEKAEEPADSTDGGTIDQDMINQMLAANDDAEAEKAEEPADSADGSTIDQDMINQMLAANDDAEAEKEEEPADSADGSTIDQDMINQMLAANDDAEAEKEEEPADSADGSTIDQDMINQILAGQGGFEEGTEEDDSTDSADSMEQEMINQMLGTKNKKSAKKKEKAEEELSLEDQLKSLLPPDDE